jgi:CheY-like chemotaxis protein
LPIVDRPGGYRAYAGAQLIAPDGHSIGTVCVLDPAPRTPTPRQLDALRVIATRVMALLESRQNDLAPAPPVSVGPPRPAASPPSPPAAPSDGPRAVVLIVDDEDLVRGVTAAIVARLGYETRLATNGQEALDRFAALDGRVRLVITDINMPMMDGIELARVLRRQPNAPAIAAMSGRFTPENRRQLQDEGVTHFISKPFGTTEIEGAVRALLAPAR